jgi:hypothetical protein
MRRPSASQQERGGAGGAPVPAVGSKVVLAGTRRRATTEGTVVAQLRNGWLVVDFPAFCWIGEVDKLEALEDARS